MLTNLIGKMFNFIWFVIDSSLQTNGLKWLDSFCDSALKRPSHESTLTRLKNFWHKSDSKGLWLWLCPWLDKYDSATPNCVSVWPKTKCEILRNIQTWWSKQYWGWKQEIDSAQNSPKLTIKYYIETLILLTDWVNLKRSKTSNFTVWFVLRRNRNYNMLKRKESKR